MKWLRSTTPVKLMAGVLLALLAVWQLPAIVDRPSGGFMYWLLSALLQVLFAALLLISFTTPDQRLKKIAYPLGFLFALFAVLGKPMNTTRALPVGTVLTLLTYALNIAVFTVLFGSVIVLLYRVVLWLIRRMESTPTSAKKESFFSRLVGNGFFAFALVLLCWVPVWLAFYPGTFRYDADTQFYSYMDAVLTTHHPLLHTLMLGWLTGIGNDADSLTLGVAIYSAVQMVLMAGILGYACAWLHKHRVPLGLRIAVLIVFAVFPLFPLWSFSATKDVLFGGFVMLLCLQMVDLWQEGAAWLKHPLRVACFVFTAALMMLLRNNGMYAFVLALPFAVIAAKGRRIRTALLLAVCVGVFLGSNTLLINAVEAGPGSYVEMLSIPLQQVARAASQGTVSEEDSALLGDLFTSDLRELYIPMCADNVKWNLDEDVLTAGFADYAALWLRVGQANPRLYLEAFLEQNLPYYYPGAKMQYNIVLGVLPMDMYTLEEAPVLPQLRPFYEAYDASLTLFGVPVTELFSDNAVMVWVTLLLLGLAIYRRQRGTVIAGLFLLAIWGSCLLGPIAAMRYMLGLFYAVPVLAAGVFGKEVSKQ